MLEKVIGRYVKSRRAAQLVALVALSLLVGGVESILKQAGDFTAKVWSSIATAISNLFGSTFHW